jgi:succinoglycan biosynthesis protein ExoO
MSSMTIHKLEERPGFWLTPYVIPNRPIRVTVVVPTFCAEATLERALRSVLSQSMREIEIIVVDDASTDGSWNLIEALALEDSRLRGMRNKQNCGKPVGMNRAIALARGRWLAILDADDWYHPERLAALTAIAERWQADMVADNQYFFDAVANRIVGTAWKPTKAEWSLTFDGFLEGSTAYATFNLGMLKPIIRTDFIHRATLGYDEQARHGQDFFHLLQFYLAGGKAVVTDKPYYHYTQPFGAISRTWSHVARRRYDFQTAYLINQRHVAEAQNRLTPAQAIRLERRNSQLRSLEYYYQAKQCIANRDILGAVQRLARDPAMLTYAFWRLRRIFLRRTDARSIERVAARSRKAVGRAISTLTAAA